MFHVGMKLTNNRTGTKLQVTGISQGWRKLTTDKGACVVTTTQTLRLAVGMKTFRVGW